jgi:hypothetical protein
VQLQVPGCPYVAMKTYQGYGPWLGHYSALDVAIAYLERFGCQPESIEWEKPGMWLAGPIETKPATAQALGGSAVAAAPSVEANEQPGESVTPTWQEGQMQWTQVSLI